MRPDNSYSTGLLGRFSSSPTTLHWAAGMQLLKYLAGTRRLVLNGRKGVDGTVGYGDSEFACDLDGFKSTSGTVFLSGETVMSWGSKLQNLAALSTVEAEFILMSTRCSRSTLAVKVIERYRCMAPNHSPGLRMLRGA